jgi:pimeloyl-ACP methyl ester carboxylesterase
MEPTYATAALPLCDLHYLRMGSGPPLIMVPATVSELDNWLGLVAFMAQRFTAFFFELPGHGKSTALLRYSSRHVAQAVVDLVDHLGLERINLMGFSFGGILALTMLTEFSERVDSVILISPLLDSDAIKVSRSSRLCLRAVTALVQHQGVQNVCCQTLRSNLGSYLWSEFLARVGHVEHKEQVRRRLTDLSSSTVRALTGQAKEILGTHRFSSMRYPQRCYFAMSVRDPLLDFAFTSTAVKQMFADVDEVQLDLPYHQPPEPLTLTYLNETYRHLLDRIP